MKLLNNVVVGAVCAVCLSAPAVAEPPASERVEALLSSLSLEQKVAQMIQGEIKHVSPDDLKTFGLGSVLNGGGSFPNDDRGASIDDWRALADAYFEASVDRSAGNAGIPVIWGTDAVHGHNNVVGATIFPHNIGLGAANDPGLVSQIAEATAKEVAATGIDWIFAPTVAVATDPRWGRTYESYSSDPNRIADYTPGVIKAIQGQGLAATAKHFIGDGGTFRGIDQGDTRLPLETLLQRHGQGYLKAIDADVMTVMASFNSWNGEKIHGNKQLLTEVLKGELGFDGFVVSDWNGIGQVEGCENDSCPQAINAGIDMVMAPEDWRSLHANMVSQVRNGTISMSRIDDAVRRILSVKERLGLLDAAKPSARYAVGGNVIGSDAHRGVAREAVRKSLVLLKDNSALLPIKPNQTVLVTGAGADSISMQTGGWTISWQGTGNTNADFPGATSIRDGLRAAIGASGGQVVEHWNQQGAQPDLAVVVFGEQPYAEGVGDIPSLVWQPGHKSDLHLIRAIREAGIPVVGVFLTGRPMWVNPEINASDAFVVAWLPGSEGAGVADVLVADADGLPRFPFTGRLPFDWPNEDLNDEDHDVPVTSIAFERGYGLDYGQPNERVASLSERQISERAKDYLPVFVGGSRQPWELYVGDTRDWGIKAEAATQSSAGGALRVTQIDHRIQADARKFEWSSASNELRQVFWQAPEAIDFTPVEAAGGLLRMEVRVQVPPTEPVQLRMDCGWPCSGAVEMEEVFGSLTPDTWHSLSVPLACFARAGADLGQISTPFLLATEGALSLDVASVEVTAKRGDYVLQDCTTPDGLLGQN